MGACRAPPVTFTTCAPRRRNVSTSYVPAVLPKGTHMSVWPFPLFTRSMLSFFFPIPSMTASTLGYGPCSKAKCWDHGLLTSTWAQILQLTISQGILFLPSHATPRWHRARETPCSVNVRHGAHQGTTLPAVQPAFQTLVMSHVSWSMPHIWSWPGSLLNLSHTHTREAARASPPRIGLYMYNHSASDDACMRLLLASY